MPESDPSDFELEQEQEAAAEAAAIGGHVSDEPDFLDDPEADPAQRPLIEAGEGEAEGFELAEQELIEHASHGDEHAAGRILEDAPDLEEDPRVAIDGEPDEASPEDE
ncbi:MAG: hypothetical protein JOZ07_15155 [Solirubrobacterales bacterium]|nr:hypothetical protein [Solirubrobacterales bacterium]